MLKHINLHLQQLQKVSLQRELTKNEMFLLHPSTRPKRDPVHLQYAA